MRVDRNIANCVVAVGITGIPTQVAELVLDSAKTLRHVDVVHTVWFVPQLVGLADEEHFRVLSKPGAVVADWFYTNHCTMLHHQVNAIGALVIFTPLA